MNSHALPSRRRAMHLPKYGPPVFTGENMILEFGRAVMRDLMPDAARDLPATQGPPPARPASASRPDRVILLSARPVPALRRQAALLAWVLASLHRDDPAQVGEKADWSLLVRLLTRLDQMTRPGRRRPGRRGSRPLDGAIWPDPKLEQAPRGVAEPVRGAAEPCLAVHGVPAAPAVPEELRLGQDASVFDTRFHAPVQIAGGKPLLVTMVDAEEAFDWSGPFRRDAPDVTSMSAQVLAHRVFERHGVVPLYLVDHPVATQDAGRAPLRELLGSGACEIGAQMHPWVTPPFTEALGEHNSYAGNLPVELELAKARALTDTLADTFGEAPRIYRTGRFGAGPRTADILKSLGYLADSSVTPYWPPQGVAGDHWGFSAQPHWLDRERRLMEIPVSAALVGRLAGSLGDGRARRVVPVLFGRLGHRLRMGGVLARLGLLERIRLSPEGMTIAEAKRLVRHMLAAGHRTFVLTYHSPSLAPGNTPYVRNAAELDGFLRWLDEFYAFFREEAGGRFGSWRDVHGAATPAPAASPVATARRLLPLALA